MAENDLEVLAKAYLDAFHARDVDDCLNYFADDATIIFQTGTYRGLREVEAWHRDRFAADLRLTKVKSITVDGETATIEGTATSNRLRAWKIGSINGHIILTFDDNKIKEAKFGAKMGPLQML